MTPAPDDSPVTDPFERLWTDYLEGELDENGILELNRLLGENLQLAARAADLYSDHRLLGWTLRPTDQSAFVADTIARLRAESEQFVAGVRERLRSSDDTNRAAAPPRDRRESHLSWLPWLLTAMASIALAVLGTDRLRNRVQPAPAIEQKIVVEQPIAALLVAEVNARFESRSAPDAIRFGPGDYELQEGIVHLRFSSGADVVIPSPAKFTIRDSMHMQLQTGSLRALVAPSAHGFTVDATGVCYEDLGTEFGVSVAKDLKQSEVHIFGGAVDVKSEAGTLLSSLTLGQSARVAEGRVLGPAEAPVPGLYPTPSDVGLLGWQQWRDQIKADPTLVCYYPFESRPDDRTVLTDATGSRNGRIEGARWVSGRWPGKQALLFDRSEDGVEVSLPEDYRQLTVTAWMWVDRVDFGLNAVFNSNNYVRHGLHMQFTRTGHPYVGLYGNGNTRRTEGEPDHPGVPVGRWVHFAGVVDLDKPWCAVYLDGELADITSLTVPNLRVRPGLCRIGNWAEGRDTLNPERGFRGRIDEFAIWRRALEPSELRRHVELGRPSLIAIEPAR